MNKFDELGITLNGGGTRGVVLAGALKYLEEIGIAPKFLVGSSAGAVVASALGAGYSAEEIFEIFANFEPMSALNPLVILGGGLDYDKWVQYGEKFLEGRNFDDLKFPVALRAVEVNSSRNPLSHLPKILTDNNNNAHRYLNEGNVAESVVASSAVYNPYQLPINNKFYRDGDLMPKTGVEMLKEMGAKNTILLNIIFPSKGLEGRLSKAFRTSQAKALSQDTKIASPTYIVNFEIEPGSIFSKKLLVEDFDLGYSTMKSYIENIKES